jgi:hypothetical protein
MFTSSAAKGPPDTPWNTTDFSHDIFHTNDGVFVGPTASHHENKVEERDHKPLPSLTNTTEPHHRGPGRIARPDFSACACRVAAARASTLASAAARTISNSVSSHAFSKACFCRRNRASDCAQAFFTFNAADACSIALKLHETETTQARNNDAAVHAAHLH